MTDLMDQIYNLLQTETYTCQELCEKTGAEEDKVAYILAALEIHTLKNTLERELI